MAWPTAAISTTSMDASSDDASQARAEIKQMADNVNIIKDARSQANGIASLDAGGKVPTGELPTLNANQGGTGQTAYTVGDILYASAPGTLTKLNAATAGYVLTSNGPGIAPSWQQSGDGMTSGTRMPFNQSTAPVGWTKDTDAALNDSIMRIVNGTVSNGGANGFSSFNAQNSTGGHSILRADLPTIDKPSGSQQFLPDGVWAQAIKSGSPHSHSLVHDIKYRDFIIAQKD